ncbi:MAG: M13 family metallopeptidase [Pseudomonadota bacterium]
MIRISLAAALLAATALAGCASGPDKAAIAEQTAITSNAAVGPVAPATARKPQLGEFGFDAAGMDRAVQPGNDFYGFANGSWAKTTQIPADQANYGMFTLLDDLSRARTREILDKAATDPNSKIGTAYATYQDQAAIDAKGLGPIQPWLGEIKALKSKAGYVALAAKADRAGVGLPFAAGVNQDDKRPDTYVMGIYQSGLGMPDREYYLSKDAKMVATRAAYLAYLTKIMTLAGEPNAAARAQAVLNFETQVATAHWTRIDSRDATKTYNPMTLAQLQARATGIDWAGYFKAQRATVGTIIVAQPTALAGIARLVRAAPLGVLKDHMIVRSLGSYAAVLPAGFDQAQFAFYGTQLSGTPQQEPRWKRAVSFTSNALSDDVSQVYVKQYFPPETKAAADTLVKNVIAAMDRRIDTLDWMAPETKLKAHAKLAAFTPKIGYPDRWQDYSALTIARGDAFGNAWRAREWNSDDNLAKLNEPIRRWEWGMTPMTINAYANFGMVEIVFPAAILQPPFFDPDADPAVNYGGIGAVIGHELSHHFDDQGAKYDASGRLTDWWTPADVKAFGERTGALAAQYDKYEALPGSFVQGKLTLGENIADLAGLTVAHDAYRASLNGAKPEAIGGFTADQRFYLGWAQVWRRNYREANLRQRLLTDPHSPSPQRVAVVRNLDPWYIAFGAAPGETLFLAPKDRVRIW